MKRRTSFFAAGICILAIVMVGLGAQRNVADETSGFSCETDLGSVFEMCQRGEKNCPCENAPEVYANACQAGCVMGLCPEQVACSKDAPLSCASCEEMNGARFWRNLLNAAGRCDDKFHVGYEQVDLQKWNECRREDMEQHCSALVGTDWWVRFGETIKK